MKLTKKDAKVYLRAAELVDTDATWPSCMAIWSHRFAPGNSTPFHRIAYREFFGYEPDCDMHGKKRWGVDRFYDDLLSIPWAERTQVRVLMLCLMAAVCEAGE